MRAVLRLAAKPVSVKAGDKDLSLVGREQDEGYTWRPLPQGGVLKLNHHAGHAVTIALP